MEKIDDRKQFSICHGRKGSSVWEIWFGVKFQSMIKSHIRKREIEPSLLLRSCVFFIKIKHHQVAGSEEVRIIYLHSGQLDSSQGCHYFAV